MFSVVFFVTGYILSYSHKKYHSDNSDLQFMTRVYIILCNYKSRKEFDVKQTYEFFFSLDYVFKLSELELFEAEILSLTLTQQGFKLIGMY